MYILPLKTNTLPHIDEQLKGTGLQHPSYFDMLNFLLYRVNVENTLRSLFRKDKCVCFKSTSDKIPKQTKYTLSLL